MVRSTSMNGTAPRTPTSHSRHDNQSAHLADLGRDVETTTLNTAQPRVWHVELSTVSRKAWRQLLGLNPFKTSYFSLFRPLKDSESRTTLLAACLFAVAAGLPLPIIGVIFSKIIDSFPPTEDELRSRIAQLLGVAAGYFAVTAGYTITWGLTGERISRYLREALVERLLGLDQAYFDIHNPDVTNLLTDKIETVQIGTSEKVGIFIQSISYFVAAFVVGFILNARLTGILFAAVIPLMTFIVVSGSHWVSKYSKKASEFAEHAGRLAEGAISSVKVVQAFNMSNRLTQEHYRLLCNSARFALRKSLASALMLGAVFFTAYAANALAFYEGSRLARKAGLDGAGTVYAVVFLILDAAFVVGQFGPFLGAFATAAAAGESIYSVLDRESTHIDVYSACGAPLPEEAFRKDIHFKSATFVYPSRSTSRALDELDLVLKAGTMNAIVGSSGCGKSTLVSLLLRLYDVSSGKIFINGEDIKNFNLASLRAQVSLVEQESVIFSGSILDNIRYGLGEHKLGDAEAKERCLQAADDAHLDFVAHLPDGIDTVIGQGGYVNLSGGQKQRICLARALVKRPSLLLLDEPTSALDSASEMLVLEAVRRAASRGTTVVMVAHRLATVTDAGNIVLMGAGKVLEQGNHEDLMEADGAYKAMIEAQTLASTPEVEKITLEKTISVEYASAESLARSSSSSVEKSDSDKSSAKDKSKQMSTRTILRRCFRLSRPDSPWIFLGLVASIVSGGVILGEAIVFGNLIQLLNEDSQGSNFLRRANLFCLIFFLLAIAAFLSYTISGSAFGLVSAHFVAKVQDLSLKNILRQDMQWFSGHSTTSIMTSLKTEAGQLSCLSGVALGTIFTVTTSVLGGIILSHVVAWKIAVVLLSAVPVMIASGYIRLRVLAMAEARHRTAYSEAASIAAEACRSIRTVAALGKERGFCQKYKDALAKPYKAGLRFSLFSNTLLALSLSITYFVYALAYWWGSKQVRSGMYTELQFFIVLPALLFSAQSAGQVFSLSPEIARANAAARNVFTLHDEKPSIMADQSLSDKLTGVLESVSTLGEKKQSGPAGQIELADVTLAYPSKPDIPALSDVSLAIRPGEFVALVGSSGAGKSTIISLLERFYDPTAGVVLMDGEDIRLTPVTEHRARLGLVPQDPDLFPGSVSYNIGLGAAPGQTVSDHDIQDVCKQCGIHDFIMSLPEAYNTECGVNGSKLSGGQKQRIAIARALVRSPEVLLLDEYTSALDAHSEQDIKEAVKGASTGRTTIVVAHRLSTVQDADRIYVFEQGKIAEVGKHADLVARGGMYASMVKAQTLV